MDGKKSRMQVIKISVFITSLFVIFLSVTYAFINVRLIGTKRQVITTGKLELELKEDENNLTIENALPMYDDVGMLQSPFTFRLISNTSVDTNYVLKLVDITTGEKLETSIVKYGLTKDGQSTIKKLSTLKNGIVDKGKILGNTTIEYSLRLWIDANVEDHQLIEGKSLSYKVEVEISQDVEMGEPGGTLKVIQYNVLWNTPMCDDNFCKYSEFITSLVFENKIDIPDTIADDKKFDVSEVQDGSVMMYLEDDGTLEYGDPLYRMLFQGENGVYANPDSSLLFLCFHRIRMIEGIKYLNMSKVTDINSMFYGCSSLVDIDLSNFDTLNVTDMSYMFYGCSSLVNLDLSNFDTSNVTHMDHMFYECSSLVNLDLSSFDVSNVQYKSIYYPI